MDDWIFKPNRRARLVDWWALDSWLDSSVYGAWAHYKDWWASYSAFFGRFRVTGARKIATEVVSESANLAILGLLALLTFCLPAIEETNNAGWRTASEFSVTFLDRGGAEVGKRGILYSDAVPLSEIPDVLIKATMATEDRRFFEHFGIDVIGTIRAAVANIQNKEISQGGSSLTQQLAKNLFLSSERSFDRKIKEAFIALWLEARLTKREILKMYLDRSYMGGGTFGVEAASQFYFGKSARDINLAEAAMLAGLFKAPTKYAPHANPAESRARSNIVLTAMVDAGYMTEGQVHGARLNPAKVVERTGSDAANYFLDWAFEEIQRVMQGKGEYSLTALSTLDTSMQNAAEQAIAGVLAQNGKAKRVGQAAMVAMETDGAVRAMVGGKDYGDSQFNRAAHAIRQPGSSFKPYVYLTAMERGFRPSDTMVDNSVSCGNHTIGNYEGSYKGTMTLTRAMALSRNTIAAKLSFDKRVTRDRVLAHLRKVGININRTCTMALGDQGITPLQHVSGFATFANGGYATCPYAFTEIRNLKDEVVYTRDTEEKERLKCIAGRGGNKPAQIAIKPGDPEAEENYEETRSRSRKRNTKEEVVEVKAPLMPGQIFATEDVSYLNQMLRAVVTEGTGTRAELDFTYSAGKTGTSSDYKDAWFMGYTGQLVAGVWLGNDNFTAMNEVTGGVFAAPVWKEFMVAAHTSYNIPTIPGLPTHPRQQEEQLRLAEVRRDDPAFGAIPEGTRTMPARTRKILMNLNKLFKATPKLDETDNVVNRGASLDPGQTVVKAR
ncbi:MAG: PBP1A family penicillin-binding protein [Hyphomicrobiales bacterium]|nr:PBP1A family penicillin-binding protein [Hyphomicrobiales bacterium]